MTQPRAQVPLPDDWPLAKLPPERIEEIQRTFGFVARSCAIIGYDDDNQIRPILTRLGVPGMEAIPMPDNTGWGRIIMASDGTRSYAVHVFKGYLDPRKNGYEMLSFDTLSLIKFRKMLGAKKFTVWIESLLWMMGVDGTEKIKTVQPWDFLSLN